jgi:hypothetical protein
MGNCHCQSATSPASPYMTRWDYKTQIGCFYVPVLSTLCKTNEQMFVHSLTHCLSLTECVGTVPVGVIDIVRLAFALIDSVRNNRCVTQCCGSGTRGYKPGSGSETGLEPYQNSSKKLGAGSNLMIMTLKIH